MSESLTLTTPQSNTAYTIDSIFFDWSRDVIDVWVRDVLGNRVNAGYGGNTAHQFMVTLNKANLTTNSLQKRVLTQLAADGKLPPGNVTGTPE